MSVNLITAVKPDAADALRAAVAHCYPRRFHMLRELSQGWALAGCAGTLRGFFCGMFHDE